MMAFYAAVGRYRISETEGRRMPYIQKLGKLQPISIPEFVIWSALMWEVLSYEEVRGHYERTLRKAQIKAPDLDEMLDMLLGRRLIVRGLGYTAADALYNMLSDAFVVPYWTSGIRKAAVAAGLWFHGRIGTMDLLRQFRRQEMSDNESRIVELVRQTPLSTSELIRCFDREISDVSTPEQIISGIYTDGESGQTRIGNEARPSKNANAVIRAVADLYMTGQIVLEVI